MALEALRTDDAKALQVLFLQNSTVSFDVLALTIQARDWNAPNRQQALSRLLPAPVRKTLEQKWAAEERKADPSRRAEAKTDLHRAFNSPDEALRLLAGGADVDALNQEGETARRFHLRMLDTVPPTPCQLNVLTELLNRGATPNGAKLRRCLNPWFSRKTHAAAARTLEK